MVEAVKPIITAAPGGGEIDAEIKLLNRDGGFVAPRQTVKIELEAFSFARHAMIDEDVLSISPDAVEDEKLDPFTFCA